MNELIERLREEAASWDLLICDGATDREAINRNSHASRRAALLREVAAALEAAREDAERLDWFDTNWFTAYRNCDPIGLSKHCVLVDESQRTRRRCVADTFRTAIDQARGKGVQDEA